MTTIITAKGKLSYRRMQSNPRNFWVTIETGQGPTREATYELSAAELNNVLNYLFGAPVTLSAAA